MLKLVLHYSYLCVVSITVLPSLMIPVIAFQTNRLVTGSIPLVGSSRKTTGGWPTRAIAVLSFLLLPPLHNRQHNKYLVYALLIKYNYINIIIVHLDINK